MKLTLIYGMAIIEVCYWFRLDEIKGDYCALALVCALPSAIKVV